MSSCSLQLSSFSYTTLFRSLFVPVMRRFALFAALLALVLVPARGAQARSLSAKLAAAMRGAGRHAGAYVLDRKSTRLNSGHRCMSYVVFCLRRLNEVRFC